ncbi:MAG: hypothetical protein COW84_01660 [Gammaproteobacteria bacterium CG22_combo_CG10-13_8_21_14_all_40_8]|nr:MAG: hypothetical protein COW84_01660 [Gammaproteobacteria bacterium CG22_combo_CG10-13_8_21_14_all_40_8]
MDDDATRKAGEWIELVKSSLDSSDPLYGKKIFVSGIHESKMFVLVDNDSDNSYAIVSIEPKLNKQSISCATVEQIFSRENLALKLKQEHEQRQFSQSGILRVKAMTLQSVSQ